MRLGHFAIENKGGVGVKFFLQFVQLFVASGPGPEFVHHQQHVPGFLVDREKVNNGRIGDAGVRFCHAIRGIGFQLMSLKVLATCQCHN